MKTQILNYLSQSFGIEGEDALELYNSFIATLAENMGKFDTLMDSANFEELTRTAHTVKGCAMNSGHQEMAEVALQMEMAAKNHDCNSCKILSVKIKELFSMLE
ncbi:MAG: Hpt domain-containing protein [Bacteroidia bacterium]|nr:Hpt domain-containing protein [Bacteroidia bacterium]